MYCVHIHRYVHLYTGTCVCVEVRGQSQVIFSPSLYLIFFFRHSLSVNLELDSWSGWLTRGIQVPAYLYVLKCWEYRCMLLLFIFLWVLVIQTWFSCLSRKLFIDLAISPAPNTCNFSHLLLCVVKVSLEHCFGIWAVLEYLGKMNCLHTNGINHLPTSVCKY